MPFRKLLLVLFHLPILTISGNMLSFNVGSKEAFEVSLADVSQTQLQGKTDVVFAGGSLKLLAFGTRHGGSSEPTNK